MYNLHGKVAIVTGSGRRQGLGKAMAARLAAEGCAVVIADLGEPKGPQFPPDAIGSTQEMEAIAQEIRADGGNAIAVPCDVRDESQVEAMV
ncbi:MAG: SDR family oxidoreductase, partial [Dehalococcoidia bacterium]|nr:SDR family oxidoreductase [Dehalococcoidia bacterium]